MIFKKGADFWRRVMLKGTAFTGNYGKLRMLYSIEDPWEMASAREQHRFKQTLLHLQQLSPRFETVLELGCGEGHQSSGLAKVTDSLDGIDVSDLATKRAAQRVPTGTFTTLPLEEIPAYFEDRKFDLITACEVLYYAKEISEILDILKARTRRLYVSNYLPRSVKMRAHFEGEGWRRLNDIEFEGTVWECFVWESAENVVSKHK